MAKTPKYKNPNLDADARARDLLKQMTLQEKVGQLISTTPVSQVKDENYSDELVIEKSKELIDQGVGQIGVAARHSTPKGSATIVNEIQRYALEESRLGIPVLVQDECVHGCKASGSTMFPMSIGLAATWDTALMKRIVDAIGTETRARGIRQCFSPTLNIARDVRCGRVEETYGEDPYLAAKLGVAFIKTLQQHGIAATPKHFVANFVGDGGRDSHAIHFSERILREIYFPAFKAAVKEAKTMSLMIAHTAIDGIPCSANHWLMDDILRKEWGFDGFIVPDNTDVQKNHFVHSMVETYEESAKRCLEAGLDTDLSWTPPEARLCYLNNIPKLVEEGKVSEKTVNKATLRILRAKFMLGLFENPYEDPDKAVAVTQSSPHRAMAREAAHASMVLLKNERNALPLSRKLKKIALIGPNAKAAQLGGYTCDDARAVTPYAGIKAKLGKDVEILYAKGCGLLSMNKRGFKQAVAVAKQADVVVLCMGNSSDKIIGQPDVTEGERHDRSNLDLPGLQEQLIDAVTAVNKNAVVVLQGGSAVTMQRWVDKVNAIVEAWYPGAEGGHAIADTLFGDCNPGGKLPITFPIHTGQLPLYYNPRPHGRVSDYCDQRGVQEQFPFGHGLSYTEFSYDKIMVKKKNTKKLSVEVSFKLTNIGERDGDEVVQLYLRDCYSSITRPIKELRRFERLSLAAGESRTVSFTLDKEDFGYLDVKMKPILEPGDFDIMIGSSSSDIRLTKTICL